MESITLRREVLDRRTDKVRWVVLATFAVEDSGSAHCVEYRVRVVPEGNDAAAKRIGDEMDQQVPMKLTDLEPVPAAGIPRYVFEQASQTRLLAHWQARFGSDPDWAQKYLTDPIRMMAMPSRAPRGRPPLRELAEKLRILSDVERAYADGHELADVATAHQMSRSGLRDLLSWARHEADPPLFTTLGPGRRGGQLTPAARAMLEHGVRT